MLGEMIADYPQLLQESKVRTISFGRYVRYCPARWIELKVVSLERSLSNRRTGRFFRKTSATLSSMTTYGIQQYKGMVWAV